MNTKMCKKVSNSGALSKLNRISSATNKHKIDNNTEEDSIKDTSLFRVFYCEVAL